MVDSGRRGGTYVWRRRSCRGLWIRELGVVGDTAICREGQVFPGGGLDHGGSGSLLELEGSQASLGLSKFLLF